MAPPGARPAVPGEQVEDVDGLLVVPGLIDLHGHWYEGSPVRHRHPGKPAGGVTTAVDAGTAGFSNFGEFRRHTIDTSPSPRSWRSSTSPRPGW